MLEYFIATVPIVVVMFLIYLDVLKTSKEAEFIEKFINDKK